MPQEHNQGLDRLIFEVSQESTTCLQTYALDRTVNGMGNKRVRTYLFTAFVNERF
jgi:hypothetical protein